MQERVNGRYFGYSTVFKSQDIRLPIESVAIARRDGNGAYVPDAELDFEIVRKYVYQVYKEDFDVFLDFFKRCADHEYMIQAYWS